VLSLTVIATSILHGEFLRREKIELIDQQVRETATVLLNSPIGELRKIEFQKVERILSEELGENRIGKFFVIRDNAGKRLYESYGTKRLPIEKIPRSPRWISLHVKGQYIRILNLDLPRIENRTVQVGVVIDGELLSPDYFSRANLIFNAVIMCLGMFVAWLLTAVLIRPISSLAAFVDGAANSREHKPELPPLPKDLRSLARSSSRRDELTSLLVGFETLIERVNRDYRLSRFWSYQMAHELKTPMALIEMQVAEAQRLGLLPDHYAKSILAEVFEVSETITSFLTWAEVENATKQTRLHVIRASKVLDDLYRRLEIGFKGRLDVRVEQDFNLMSNIQHAEQALGNVIMNALIYSPPDRPVLVEILSRTIRVSDSGPGLPSDVMKRIGEPFNKGEQITAIKDRKANGLGLALVYSIARLYRWRVGITTTVSGTSVTLEFPPTGEEKVEFNRV
jgi:signal transduction histidine kinase